LKKFLENKWTHICLIIIGAIFILLGAFHTEVWYDEAYTISLIRHDISEIIRIDNNDVHPVLYYLLLKAVTIIFGESILVCRLFSVVAGIIMAILGYTHIRKDFGAKTGFFYSFLTLFLPFMAMYGQEIRMYTWTMLFVTLSGIYAYRIIKNYKIKNWILFAIFSLAAAHSHYYGLVAVAIINLMIILYIAFSKKQIEKKKYIVTYLITALVQILGYLPWLFVFIKQATAVSKGYWIPLNLGDTVFAPLGVQFNGRLSVIITVIFTVIMYSYLIYQIICFKKQNKPIALLAGCLIVHFTLYISMVAVTLLIKPIMYFRYMLVTTGILIFPFAFSLANTETKKQKIISSIIVIIIISLSIYNNIIVIGENYNKSNGEEVQYIKNIYKDEDIIIYNDIFHGTNIFVQIPEYNWYLEHIDPEKNITPYENFSPPLKITFEEEFLKNYKGRIIIIDHEELEWYNNINEKYNLKEIERKQFKSNYRGIVYQIILVEK